jgi:Family of unknown function (DUF5908)
MPVQINEVIIRAVVDPRPKEKAGTNPVNCPPGSNTPEGEMLERILEIIKEKTER